MVVVGYLGTHTSACKPAGLTKPHALPARAGVFPANVNRTQVPPQPTKRVFVTDTSTLTMVPLYILFSGRNGMPSPRSLNDPMALHSTVMRLFGPVEGESPRSSAGVLFRVEPAEQQRPGILLVRSSQKPATTLEGMISRTESAPPPAGTPVAFRVAVNAIRRHSARVKAASTDQSALSPIVPRDDDPTNTGPAMTEWLAARLAGALSEMQILNHDRRVIGLKSNRIVQTDLVDGFAVVEDADRLGELLSSGVGRAKNYGCGLLTVKAIR